MRSGPPPVWRTLFVLAVVAVPLGAVALSPPRDARTVSITSEETETIAGPVAAGGDAAAPVPGAARRVETSTAVSSGPSRPVAAAREGLECAAGRNGGATDTGVSGDTIKLGATVVDSGIGAAFLRDARYGILAVKDKVNRAGGICGRKLDLKLVDDGWSFQRGGDFLRSLIEDDEVFALAVVPSSEGLKNISDSGYLREKGVPVVGSDGMLIHQYTDPSIWPVASSTISTMHIIAKFAHDERFKARSFGLVYESTYHFGIEGAYAFEQAIERLTGKEIPGYSDPTRSPRCHLRFCGIQAGQPAYTAEIQTFNDACFSMEPKCDYVVLLLEPATALTWINGGAFMPGGGRTSGVSPLFTRDFAEQCGRNCNGMWLWIGYIPAIEGNVGRPAVASFIEDIRHASSSADPTNSFVEGAYVGMSALAEALKRTGPDLTRARLKATLNSMTFDPGLTLAPLTWTADNHFANYRMQAYSIQYKDRFSGWRDEQAALADPWVGQDMPS